MDTFLSCEAAYLSAPEPVEPRIEDLDEGCYECEGNDSCCPNKAVVELKGDEDNGYPYGFFCQRCLEEILEAK